MATLDKINILPQHKIKLSGGISKKRGVKEREHYIIKCWNVVPNNAVLHVTNEYNQTENQQKEQSSQTPVQDTVQTTTKTLQTIKVPIRLLLRNDFPTKVVLLKDPRDNVTTLSSTIEFKRTFNQHLKQSSLLSKETNPTTIKRTLMVYFSKYRFMKNMLSVQLVETKDQDPDHVNITRKTIGVDIIGSLDPNFFDIGELEKTILCDTVLFLREKSYQFFALSVKFIPFEDFFD